MLYHLAVLLRSRGLSLADAEEVLRCPASLRAPTTSSRSARRSSRTPRRRSRAFLKLRGVRPGVPARVGRAGPARRPLVVHRLQAAQRRCAGRWPTAATRTRSPPPRSRRFRQAPARGADPVHRRRRRLLRLRLRARRRAPRGAEPGPRRPAGHGADAVRRDRRVRPPQAHGHDPRQRLRRRARGGARARPRGDPRGPRAARRARCRAPTRAPRPEPQFESNMPREAFEAMVARIIEYVHAGDAFQVVPSPALVGAEVAGRAVLDLPRPAGRQPVAVHVLPRLRGLPDRRRVARAADHRLRPPRLDAPDRRHAAARRDASTRTRRSPRSCSPTRRSAPST